MLNAMDVGRLARELSALRASARLATRGDWAAGRGCVVTSAFSDDDRDAPYYGGKLIGESMAGQDALYVAAVQPAVIERLSDELYAFLRQYLQHLEHAKDNAEAIAELEKNAADVAERMQAVRQQDLEPAF